MRRKSKDGLQKWCKPCNQEYRASYNVSERSIVWYLMRDHGYPEADALVLAPLLLSEESECALCGMGGWLVKLNYKKGGPFHYGPARSHRRMHPDRRDTRLPHTLSNTRILCPNCNMYRRAELFTDEEVLRWVRERWLSIFPPRLLWWLHTEPGSGGRRHRNPDAA
jgi:hypothetical protein